MGMMDGYYDDNGKFIWNVHEMPSFDPLDQLAGGIHDAHKAIERNRSEILMELREIQKEIKSYNISTNVKIEKMGSRVSRIERVGMLATGGAGVLAAIWSARRFVAKLLSIE